MGKCQNCGEHIRLKKTDPLICPKCGKHPYTCWNCLQIITSKTECGICHWYICNHCGKCKPSCKFESCAAEADKNLTIRKDILFFKTGEINPEITWPIYREFVSNIIATPRRSCPQKVGISFAHGKLKGMALKMAGIGVKDASDTAKFNERFDEIKAYPLGKTWTITQARAPGSLGIEYREVSNMAVCYGYAKVSLQIKTIGKKKKKQIIYSLFERIPNQEPCQYKNPKISKKSGTFCQLSRGDFL
jgi:hypothetical protein